MGKISRMISRFERSHAAASDSLRPPGVSYNDVRRGYGAGVLAARSSDDEGEQFNGSKPDDQEAIPSSPHATASSD
jgi:hypothetical protein